MLAGSRFDLGDDRFGIEQERGLFIGRIAGTTRLQKVCTLYHNSQTSDKQHPWGPGLMQIISEGSER